MSESNDQCLVELSRKDQVAVLTLARADKGNAMNREMMLQLLAQLDIVAADETIRALVLCARGSTFSVGADLNEVGNLLDEPSLLVARREAELGAKMMRALRDLPQPSICAVQGVATGAGACIAAACDFRIASDQARLGLGEVGMGMNLMWHAIPVFVELLGPARAKQLAMSGRLLDAAQLLDWGLLDRVCEADQLQSQALQWAAEYTRLPPVAVQMIKRSINRYSQALGESIMHMDQDQWLLTTRSADFRECLEAFAEKRTPNLKGQ